MIEYDCIECLNTVTESIERTADFVSVFQALFRLVSFRSLCFISKSLFRSILQTKIHLETALKPPNDHIADLSRQSVAPLNVISCK